jgi:hypothetical protein
VEVNASFHRLINTFLSWLTNVKAKYDLPRALAIACQRTSFDPVFAALHKGQNGLIQSVGPVSNFFFASGPSLLSRVHGDKTFQQPNHSALIAPPPRQWRPAGVIAQMKGPGVTARNVAVGLTRPAQSSAGKGNAALTFAMGQEQSSAVLPSPILSRDTVLEDNSLSALAIHHSQSAVLPRFSLSRVWASMGNSLTVVQKKHPLLSSLEGKAAQPRDQGNQRRSKENLAREVKRGALARRSQIAESETEILALSRATRISLLKRGGAALKQGVAGVSSNSQQSATVLPSTPWGHDDPRSVSIVSRWQLRRSAGRLMAPPMTNGGSHDASLMAPPDLFVKGNRNGIQAMRRLDFSEQRGKRYQPPRARMRALNQSHSPELTPDASASTQTQADSSGRSPSIQYLALPHRRQSSASLEPAIKNQSSESFTLGYSSSASRSENLQGLEATHLAEKVYDLIVERVRRDRELRGR